MNQKFSYQLGPLEIFECRFKWNSERKREFLVKWKNKPFKAMKWISEDELYTDYQEEISDFLTKRRVSHAEREVIVVQSSQEQSNSPLKPKRRTSNDTLLNKSQKNNSRKTIQKVEKSALRNTSRSSSIASNLPTQPSEMTYDDDPAEKKFIQGNTFLPIKQQYIQPLYPSDPAFRQPLQDLVDNPQAENNINFTFSSQKQSSETIPYQPTLLNVQYIKISTVRWNEHKDVFVWVRISDDETVIMTEEQVKENYPEALYQYYRKVALDAYPILRDDTLSSLDQLS